MDSLEFEDSVLDSELLSNMIADTFANSHESHRDTIPIEQLSKTLQPLTSDIEWLFQRHVRSNTTMISNSLEAIAFHQLKERKVSHESLAELGDNAFGFVQFIKSSSQIQPSRLRTFAESVFELCCRLFQVSLKSIAHRFPHEHLSDHARFVEWTLQTSHDENIMILLPIHLVELLTEEKVCMITIGTCSMTLEDWKHIETGTIIKLDQKLNTTLSATYEGKEIKGKLGKVGRCYAFLI